MNEQEKSKNKEHDPLGEGEHGGDYCRQRTECIIYRKHTTEVCMIKASAHKRAEAFILEYYCPLNVASSCMRTHAYIQAKIK